MKKYAVLIASVALFGLFSCSNEGAYSEEEKSAQDSADDVKIESEFDKLEKMGGDSNRGPQPPPMPTNGPILPNGQMNQPQGSNGAPPPSGIENPPMVPPQPPPPPGAPAPEPVPQKPRK